MADPVTLAVVAGVAGAGVSAFGQVQQGNATRNAALYQAQVARNNALIAEQNAQYAEKAGAARAAAKSLEGAAVGGKIKAAQAASGVDVNSGSAVNVRQSQRQQAKLDTETVLSNALLEAYGYRARATGYEAEAGLEGMRAEQAPIGAAIGATGSLLSSASSLGFRWQTMGGGGGSA